MAKLFTKFKPKRRWVQISLRSVFVLVTALCAILSMWIVPAERQRRAVAVIEAFGGEVKYAGNQVASKSFPITLLRRWFPRDYFDEIKEVKLVNIPITGAGLARLEGLTSLQVVDLGNTRLTNAGLAHLQELTSLQELCIDSTEVTDAGLFTWKG